jgi:hypothetical protein
VLIGLLPVGLGDTTLEAAASVQSAGALSLAHRSAMAETTRASLLPCGAVSN